MRALLAIAIAVGVISFVSAFAVHNKDAKEHCIDLQCPATALDYGVKNLVDEETMASEQCISCEQCNSNGYSLCMRVNTPSRASRNSAGPCSCAHSVPANCHNQQAKDRQPVNITMQMYRMCYSSSIQAPPRPLAVNEKESIILTVENFWEEPYWRELQLDNLTLHYSYITENPDHCDGNILTAEGARTEHTCHNSVQISMTGESDGLDEEYQDEYDDELPPEVQIDREVFNGAKLLTTHYTVNVRRPRQLESNSVSDPFRDLTTVVESEYLKFDMKPENYGAGHSVTAEELPEKKEEEKDDQPRSTEVEEDDENVSEERGGTDFFDETKKNPIEKTIEETDDAVETKSDELAEKEDEALEKAIEEEANLKVKDHLKEEDDEETDAEKKDEEHQDEEEDDKKASEEVTTEEPEEEKENEDEKDDTEDKEDEEEEKKDEETETGDEEDTADTTEEPKKESQEEKEDEDVDDKKEETERSQEETKDEQDEDEEKTDEEEAGFTFGFGTRKHLVRWVFAICIASCIILIACVCIKRKCCKSSSTETKVNGHRYSNPNKTNELVCSQPEKERLHQ